MASLDHVRLIVIGTPEQADAIRQQDRPDLEDKQVFVAWGPSSLMDNEFRADVAVRMPGPGGQLPHAEQLVKLAKSRRLLPALLPRNPRKEVE